MNLKKEIEKMKLEKYQNKKNKILLQIKIEKKLINELDKIKKDYFTSRTEIIRQLIKNYILEETKDKE